MHIRTLLRHPACAAYTVECRHHEHPSWIDESSSGAELVYPLAGGFLLDADGGNCVCLPARLTVLPAGSHYRIGHFPCLPDITLVVRIGEGPVRSLPDRVSHMFLAPAEAATLQLLAAALCADEKPGVAVALIASFVQRARTAAVSHRKIAAGAMRLERSLEGLLRHDAAVIECAQAAGLSEHYFRREFRNRYGTTFHPVRRTLRLARALRYLLQGGTASAAARISGFAHASHLSGELRRFTGQPPSALLRAHRAHGVREAARLWANA